MHSPKLPNYLRTFRKRAGFSEDEIAFLLGLHGSAQVSRYEHFRSTPGLITALAYHVIFQTSPPELFGGKYQKIEREVRRRAKRLLHRLAAKQLDRAGARKLASLRSIVAKLAPAEHP